MKFEVLTVPISLSVLSQPQEAFLFPTALNDDSKTISYEDFYHQFEPIQTDPCAEIISKICSFKYLSDNWNGEGGSGPDENVINNSIRFIKALPESVSMELKKEDVVATPYGTIVFDWELNNNVISVEIGEKEIGFFSNFENEKLSPFLNGATFNQNALPVELTTVFKDFFQKALG